MSTNPNGTARLMVRWEDDQPAGPMLTMGARAVARILAGAALADEQGAVEVWVDVNGVRMTPADYGLEVARLEQAEAAAAGTDRHGNRVAREGCSRCACGCKYWEADRCVSCGGSVDQVPAADR